MRLYDGAGNIKAKASATAASLLGAIVAMKDMRNIAGGNARAIIADRYLQVFFTFHCCRNNNLPLLCVLQRIVYDIPQCLAQTRLVELQVWQGRQRV